MRPKIIQPKGWPPPRGYANGTAAAGEVVHVAGQIGWDTEGRVVSADFIEQFAQALDNVIAVVKAAGGEPTDIADMTIYVTDLDAYRAAAKKLRAVWEARFGSHYPAMALVGVAGLVHPMASVEIQATAHLG